MSYLRSDGPAGPVKRYASAMAARALFFLGSGVLITAAVLIYKTILETVVQRIIPVAVACEAVYILDFLCIFTLWLIFFVPACFLFEKIAAGASSVKKGASSAEKMPEKRKST